MISDNYVRINNTAITPVVRRIIKIIWHIKNIQVSAQIDQMLAKFRTHGALYLTFVDLNAISFHKVKENIKAKHLTRACAINEFQDR